MALPLPVVMEAQGGDGGGDYTERVEEKRERNGEGDCHGCTKRKR